MENICFVTAFFSLGLGSLKSMFQNKSHNIMLSGFLVAFFCLIITTNGNYSVLFDRAVMQMDQCIIKMYYKKRQKM